MWALTSPAWVVPLKRRNSTVPVLQTLSEMVKNRLEREYQEYPEVTYSEQEKEEIKKQLTANIAELVSTLLAGENKNAE